MKIKDFFYKTFSIENGLIEQSDGMKDFIFVGKIDYVRNKVAYTKEGKQLMIIRWKME
jgi:hypothetical protein